MLIKPETQERRRQRLLCAMFPAANTSILDTRRKTRVRIENPGM